MPETQDQIDTLDSDKPLPDEVPLVKDETSEEAPPEEAEDKPEESAASEDGDDAPADEEEDRPKRRRPTLQQRINDITAARRAAEREAQAWKDAYLANQRQKAPSPDASAEPKLEDFEDEFDYKIAKAKHEAVQEARAELEADRKRLAEQQQQTRQAEIAGRFSTQVDEARARYDDFDEVAFSDDVPISEAMYGAIAESDLGAEVAYYLGSNLEEARKISTLTPVSQVREIGRIEQRLVAKPARKKTAAPEPPKRLAGSSPGEKSPENMTYDEYVKWRRGG